MIGNSDPLDAALVRLRRACSVPNETAPDWDGNHQLIKIGAAEADTPTRSMGATTDAIRTAAELNPLLPTEKSQAAFVESARGDRPARAVVNGHKFASAAVDGEQTLPSYNGRSLRRRMDANALNESGERRAGLVGRVIGWTKSKWDDLVLRVWGGNS